MTKNVLKILVMLFVVSLSSCGESMDELVVRDQTALAADPGDGGGDDDDDDCKGDECDGEIIPPKE